MSTAWPRWATDEPAQLLAYVQRRRPDEPVRGAPADLLGRALPAPGDGPAAGRARALYEAFAARGISYADEAPSSDPGQQTVRPPYEVLETPRHATCLDLALAYAGACLDAGLHPLLAVLAGRPGEPAHALVAVRLDGTWANRADRDHRAEEDAPDWRTLPADLLDQLADTADAPGAYLAVDITGTAARADAADPRRRTVQPWEDSVAHGARLLRAAAAEGRLAVTLDIGLGYPERAPHPLPDQPAGAVLAPPYQPLPAHPDEVGPLRLLWARHETVRFHPRDELDYLRDWFRSPDRDRDPGPDRNATPATRIALLHGTGGAGKTRLAAELATRLAAEGWYTGFLARAPHPQDCAWLARVASPLLVVVDYAEDRRTDDLLLLLRVLRGREQPTCLLLTARSIGDWWEHDVATELRREGHPFHERKVALAARHPRQTGVYRAALRSFGVPDATVLGAAPPEDPGSDPWTTLDLVMLAWLAARHTGARPVGARPTAEADLHEEILAHELRYWERAYTAQIGPPSRRTKQVLREAGACISLLAPRADRLDHVLTAVPELARDGVRRDQFTALFEDLLPAAPEDGTVAVRPDPLGTHLTATVLRDAPELLGASLGVASELERLSACVGITRVAGSQHHEAGPGLAAAAMTAEPELWPQALLVASAQGGPFVPVLEDLARAEPTPLPLHRIAVSVPADHTTLSRLASIAVERLRPTESPEASESARADWATWLHNSAPRQARAGQHRAALDSSTEAVAHYRILARDDAARFSPLLAMALSNLAVYQAEAGDGRAALASATEAVGIQDSLAQEDPATHLRLLAIALSNLAVQQAMVGDARTAVTTATRAVEIHRTIARSDRTADLPEFAKALGALASAQGDAGRPQEALRAILQAVAYYRDLAASNPAAHLPGLANALGHLAARQSNCGQIRAAVDTATEGVGIDRRLAHSEPAHRPHLARSLTNLAKLQAAVGRRQDALASSSEAVDLQRALVRSEPAANRPDLALSLVILARQQATDGRYGEALETALEGVELYRDLVREDWAAFLPGLASSLNDLAQHLAHGGHRRRSLDTIAEAVTHYRALARDNPDAFLPILAGSLTNLSRQQAEAGQRREALDNATEAVDHYRDLLRDDPTARVPSFAAALDNLATRYADSGRHQAALDTVTEAINRFRDLVRDDDAHLPGLANVLSNAVRFQAQLGQSAAATEHAVEAVAVYRLLTRDDPTAFRSELAIALHNLAIRQFAGGRVEEALATVAEAVEIRRAQMDDHPEAFRPELAAALTNLANLRAAAGDPDTALETYAEAVGIQRRLVDDDPDAFLPYLAETLHNQAYWLAETGQREKARETATEAVAHCRLLARDHPEAFRPQLALGLVSLGTQQKVAGEHRAALATLTEAVDLFRALVRKEPTGHRQSLALALTLRSEVEGETGRTEDALATAAEAFELYLAPPAALPDLLSCLRLLSAHQTAAGRPASALPAWERAIATVDPAPAAELLAARARWHHERGDLTGCIADLREAARLADASGDPAAVGPARRQVQFQVASLRRDPAAAPALDGILPDLPAWTTADIPDAYSVPLSAWVEARDWSGRAAVLQQWHSLLARDEGGAALAAALVLFPEHPELALLEAVLAEAAKLGLDQVLARLNATQAAITLVTSWLTTLTWAESLDHLQAHPELTTDPLVRQYLFDHVTDDHARQHLGILNLLPHLPAAEVYEAITDPATAVETAADLLDQGHTDAVLPLVMAVPELLDTPFWGPYLGGIYTLHTADGPEHLAEAERLFTAAAEQGTEVQRAAGAARLRALARHRPQDAPQLERFAELLTTD
ncbi:hypothetical protein [Kitasatospora sp. NPDC097643]|uniref:hypothetical protein n=1 Tax=Kitasatospora sp. NPDC097643 TaxID=3157230 RepID=UPI00331CA2B2